MIDNHLNYKNVVEEKEVNNEIIFKIKIKDIRKGELFKRNPESKIVYERSDYDRFERQYETWKVDGANRSYFFKGDTMVWVGFSY